MFELFGLTISIGDFIVLLIGLGVPVMNVRSGAFPMSINLEELSSSAKKRVESNRPPRGLIGISLALLAAGSFFAIFLYAGINNPNAEGMDRMGGFLHLWSFVPGAALVIYLILVVILELLVSRFYFWKFSA